MEIKSSADWRLVESELQSTMKSLKYNRDLKRLLNNIESMVRDLSREEVNARRIKNTRYLEPKITEINQAIATFEQWAFILALSQ